MALVQSSPAVCQCFHVTGSHSFIVRVVCDEGGAQLEHIINRFQEGGQTSSQSSLSSPVDRRP